MNEFKEKEILLTGASGFLGRIIKSSLSDMGFKIVGLDISGQSINQDITRGFNLDSGLNLGVVVHAAGKAHSIPKNEEEEQVFYDVNFEGTKNLCMALEKLPVKPKALVFISTVAVYGIDSGNMISEDHPLNGVTPYAKSKILAEEWLSDWAKNNGIILGILRLPLIAGPNPPGNLGAMVKGIRSGRYLSIGKASARKSVIWQEDVALIIPSLAEVGGTYNITDGRHPSFKELEIVISKAMGKNPPFTVPITLAKLLGKIGDAVGSKFPINSDIVNKITSTLTFDDSKACTMLNWKPASVLEKLSERL